MTKEKEDIIKSFKTFEQELKLIKRDDGYKCTILRGMASFLIGKINNWKTNRIKEKETVDSIVWQLNYMIEKANEYYEKPKFDGRMGDVFIFNKVINSGETVVFIFFHKLLGNFPE